MASSEPVTLGLNAAGNAVQSVSVEYAGYSAGCRVFDGHERVRVLPVGGFRPPIEWDSDITMTGCETGTKVTAPPLVSKA
jgi:hypothetical protein